MGHLAGQNGVVKTNNELYKDFGSFRTFGSSAKRFSGAGEHPTDGSSFRMWKLATYLFCVPVVIAATYINLGPNAEHGHRPAFVPYEYLRVRTKGFPWGDGNHSLFHNPVTNAVKDGYEVEEVHQSVLDYYATLLIPRRTDAIVKEE